MTSPIQSTTSSIYESKPVPMVRQSEEQMKSAFAAQDTYRAEKAAKNKNIFSSLFACFGKTSKAEV